MNRARLATGAGAVLAAIVAIASPASAQPPPCSPAPDPVVQLDGAAATSNAIRARLLEAGVDVVDPGGAGACPSVFATVIQLRNSVSVELRDSDGRRARRTVSTCEVAATWIESWIRRDLGAPLMPAVFVARQPLPGPAVATPAMTPAVDASPAPVVRAPVGRWSVAVVTEAVTATDDSAWRTVRASACVRVGSFCIGADGRYGDASELSANHGDTLARRRAADVVAVVHRPFFLGRAMLSPSVGAGLGWMNTRRDEPDRPVDNPDPVGPNGAGCDPDEAGNLPIPCTPPPFGPPYYIGDEFRVSSYDVRLQAALALTVPVTERVAIELGAGVTLAPNAHGAAFDPARMLGDPDDPPSDPMLHLPGEPDRLTWWSIGLRMESP